MDYLILNNYLLFKEEQKPLNKDSDWMSEFELDQFMFDEIKNIKSTKKELKSFGLTIGIIFLVIGGFLFFKEKDFY